MKRVTRFLARAAVQSLLLILILLLLEIICRVAHTFIQDTGDLRQSNKVWYQYSPRLNWERRPRFSGKLYKTFRTFDEQGFLKEDRDQKNIDAETKIILLGDSCTFGNKVKVAATYGEVLEGLLTNSAVINLAVPGYTSYQGVKTLEKYIDDINPDIVIVSFNFNDRRYVLHPQDSDNAARFRKVYIVNHVIPRLCHYSYLIKTLQLGLRKLYKPATGEDKVCLDEVYPRVSPEKYRSNLIEMIEMAKKRNMRIMFLSLPDNPENSQDLYRGIELLNQGDIPGAIEQLTIVAGEAKSGLTALGKKYLSEALIKRGLHDKAKEALLIQKQESLHGGQPIFLNTEYSNIMREVASEHGVEFIDAAAILRERPECFIDPCHLNKSGHSLIAKLISQVLKSSTLPKDNKIHKRELFQKERRRRTLPDGSDYDIE